MTTGKELIGDGIIDATQQTAKENGGKPLGEDRFKKETGINTYDWGKYWARFGDAQKEAGLTRNQLQGAYTEEFLIEKVIGLMRKLEKFPTFREIQVERSNDTELPSMGAFQRLGGKEQVVAKVVEYCKNKNRYDDIAELGKSVLRKSNEKENNDDYDSVIGEVYLFKHGHHYKIGKTNDTVRRGNELRIQLPEKIYLVHSIKTDDPSGIEAYWHRRFERKRMQGEWFDLNTSDVKAFKRWRRII